MYYQFPPDRWRIILISGIFYNASTQIKLDIKDTTDTMKSVSQLDLPCNDFSFRVVSFIFIYANIPSAPASSDRFRITIHTYARACPN